MVVDLLVRTKWSIQSINPDMEAHDKLSSIERIISIT